MVMACVTWLAGAGNNSSPGKLAPSSASVAPQRWCHVRSALKYNRLAVANAVANTPAIAVARVIVASLPGMLKERQIAVCDQKHACGKSCPETWLSVVSVATSEL